MSAYAKPPPQSQGFDNSRSFSDSFASVQAFTSQAQVAAASTGSFQNAPLVAAMSYSSQSRLPYDDQSGPYLNVGSTPVPQVISYQPVRGAKGTRVDVYISSLYELMTSNAPTFYLMFASRKCSATLSKIDQQGGVCQYIVSAEVPALAATGWQSSQVPLCLLMESGDGELMAKSDVGDFSYLEGNIEQANNLQDVSRKRKISLESAELMKSPIKRASNNHLRLKEESSSYGYTTSEEANFSPYLQPISQYGMMQQYARSGAQYQRQPSHRALHQYQYTNAPGSPSANIKVQSPTLSTWSLYSNVSPQVTPSPGQGVATPMARPSLSSLPSPLPANPPLVRTSTLQQTPSPGTTPAGSRHSGQAFNPYTLYPHKANLKIVGDLDTMAEGWTVDEWAASRRIVMFKRSQSGATITTTFSPVTADERPPKSVCISCIYWEEKSECYVTSVDTIYLLEHLVANRFTTEEKNRIRRNLEHFRPLTVSKSKKPDSEEFFKLIMGFPNPKPRNIEKDVKVFPWKILVHALKKIIGKYSASPASILPPALLTPVSSTGYATEGSSTLSHASGEHSGMISPRSGSRSISGISASAAYVTAGSSTAISTPISKPYLNVHGGGPPDLRFSGANYIHGSDQWQGSQNHMALGSGNPNGRGSWDLISYLDAGPATVTDPSAAGHGNAQSGGYTRRDMGDSSGLQVSEGEGNLRASHRPSQQMPTS